MGASLRDLELDRKGQTKDQAGLADWETVNWGSGGGGVGGRYSKRGRKGVSPRIPESVATRVAGAAVRMTRGAVLYLRRGKKERLA